MDISFGDAKLKLSSKWEKINQVFEIGSPNSPNYEEFIKKITSTARVSPNDMFLVIEVPFFTYNFIVYLFIFQKKLSIYIIL